jgi:fatty acid desaturase
MGASAWTPAADDEPVPGAVRGPTGLRQAVGRLAESLPPWLPASVAGPLALRMVRYATRTDRFRDRLTAEGLKRLVFPEETAWQASLAACLGVLTIALSVWPLVGLGAWLVTCTFAGLALLRLRQDVLLGGAERAWFAVACGVGPLCTGLLALAFR